MSQMSPDVPDVMSQMSPDVPRYPRCNVMATISFQFFSIACVFVLAYTLNLISITFNIIARELSFNIFFPISNVFDEPISSIYFLMKTIFSHFKHLQF